MSGHDALHVKSSVWNFSAFEEKILLGVSPCHQKLWLKGSKAGPVSPDYDVGKAGAVLAKPTSWVLVGISKSVPTSDKMRRIF